MSYSGIWIFLSFGPFTFILYRFNQAISIWPLAGYPGRVIYENYIIFPIKKILERKMGSHKNFDEKL